MLLDALRENPTFLALEEQKREKDALEEKFVQVRSNLNERGGEFYRQLEGLVLEEIDKKREKYWENGESGVNLAKKLCSFSIHPWVRRTKFTAQMVYRGNKYYKKSHKKIPKYYVEHCPICGKILCTQKRIYRLGKREIVDIPLEEFERGASEFGYVRGTLDRCYQILPVYLGSNSQIDMVSVLKKLMENRPPEVVAAIQEILDYWKGSDERSRAKTEEYQRALDNAEQLCRVFGHDVRSIDSRCKCCGKTIGQAKLLDDYKNAILSGVVDFPYLHGSGLILDDTSEGENEREIVFRFD